MTSTGVKIDPITTEIVRSAFSAAADEMNATLVRSAYTPIIYEMKDCSVALLSADHRVLGQSSGLPLFLGNLEVCTRLTEERYGVEAWLPGDVWLMNDSYLAGTHLNDMTVYGPIFCDGQLAGFAASRAHWLDVGSKVVGGAMDSTEIFQEGLRVPPLRVVEGGVQRPDVTDLLGTNSRFTASTIGDLGAQIACVRTGERRLQALIDRFGRETVESAREEIFAQTERLERAAVEAIPDGTYRAAGYVDNNGVDDDPAWVRVSVEVSGDLMTIDVTDSEDMQGGPINCGAAQTVAACRVAFKSLISPDTPTNGGAFRCLDVRVREESMLAAVEPAPCQWYFTPLGLLIDLVASALVDVLPGRAAAAHYGDSMVIYLSGRDPRHGGRAWLDNEPTAGGWGGHEGGDGEDGLINNVNGSMRNTPIEVLETRYPLRMSRFAFRTDSGGAGRRRGGTGVVREYVMEADDIDIALWFERSKTPGWGLKGGHDGTPPQVTINPGSPDERRFLKLQQGEVLLRKGDVVRLETGGGGGFGDPAEREPAALEADVLDGLVSSEAARSVYGFAAR
jgi:N-methylhydantoinase B